MQPPTVTIVRGAPTEAEIAATEAAIIALWRADVTSAVASADPWLAAARREAIGGAQAHAQLRLG